MTTLHYQTLTTFGEQARLYTIKNFGVDQMVRTTSELFRRVLDRRADNSMRQ